MRELLEGVFVETAYLGPRLFAAKEGTTELFTPSPLTSRSLSCNCGFVVTEEGIVMVDSPTKPSEAIKWRAVMKDRGEIKYLINTEFHSDHIMGNYFFPSMVIAHVGTKEVFLSSLGGMEKMKETIVAIDPDGLKHLQGYKPREPSITFSERLNLYLGDKTLNLIHLPGHTAYQVVVYLPKEKIIFTGDNVVNKTPPLFHSAVHPETWLESLGFIQNMDLDFIIPGHGEVCDKEVLSKFMENIRTIMESVQSCMDMGLSREETQKTVSYVSRFWIPPGMEERYQMLQSMSIGNIYDRLQEGKGQSLRKKTSNK